MFVLGVEVTYSLAPRVLPRVHAAVVRECNRRAMQHHAAVDLPRHFETGAGTRYGYAQRRSTINLAWLYRTDRAAWERVPKIQATRLSADKKRWEKTGKLLNKARYRDVKAVLGMQPLVWSGQFRSMVLNPSNQKITATQNRSRLMLKTPPWVSSRIRRDKGEPAKQMQLEALERHAEMQAITPGELRSIRAGFKRDYLEIMNDPTNPRHAFLGGFGGNVLRQRKRFGKG